MSRGNVLPSWLFLKLFGVGALALLLVPALPVMGPAVLGFDILLVILLFWDAGSVPHPDKIGVERRIGRKLSLGEENPCKIVLKNFTGRKVKVIVRQSFPDGLGVDTAVHKMEIGPFSSESVEFKIFAGQRGFYDLGPVYMRLQGSFGLAERDFPFDISHTVKVYPSLLGVGRYDLMMRRSHLAQIGFRQIRKVGTGTEFEKLREYLPDDDYRHVNWKATAKKRRPITQEYQIERSQNIFLCLDTSRYMAYRAGELTKLDHAINACVMLGHVAKRFDDNVGLMVFSDRIKYYHPPMKGGAMVATLVDTLYKVEPERCAVEYGGALRTLAARQKRRSLVVIFTDFFDKRDGEDLMRYLPLLRRRHLVLCLTVRDQRISMLARHVPDDYEGAFDRYVASEVLSERSRIHAILRNKGALVEDAEPSELTVAAVNQYLQVKARQLI